MQNIELEDLKSLTNSDLSEVYDLNQSLTPKLGSLLNTQHLERLIEMSDCSKAFEQSLISMSLSKCWVFSKDPNFGVRLWLRS